MDSEYTFYFCSDGILRVKYFSSHTLLDASFLRKRYSSDFSFFMAWWDKEAKLEKGLTVGKFLSCIAPFSDFWSEYTQCRIAEYIEESKKPVLVENNKTHEFDWLEISWEHYIGTSLQYEKINKEDFTSVEDYFKKERRVKVLDSVEHRRNLKLTGFYQNENEHYCANGIEMNRLAHTPIYLREYEDIFIDDYFVRKYLPQNSSNSNNSNKHLLNPEHISVFSYKKNHYEQQWLKTKAYYSLKDVVEGFFGDMEQSIEQRQHNIASIRQAIDDINMEEKPPLKVVVQNSHLVEQPHESTNIVSLFDMKKSKTDNNTVVSASMNDSQENSDIVVISDINDIEEPATNEKQSENTSNILPLFTEPRSDKKGVVISPGAFNPLIQSLQRQLHIWDDMVSEFSLEEKIVKMGLIEEQYSPDYRVNGDVVDIPNKSTDWLDRK